MDPATLDKIGLSYGLIIDNQYNIYVSDTANNRVTKWLAGNTTAGLLVLYFSRFYFYL